MSLHFNANSRTTHAANELFAIDDAASRKEMQTMGNRVKLISLVVVFVVATFFFAFPNTAMFMICLSGCYLAYEMNTFGNNLQELAKASTEYYDMLQSNRQLTVEQLTKNTVIVRFFVENCILS